jgi:hypothetical protein
LRLGDHFAAGFALQRHLIDANFQQIYLQFLGIHVVQTWLQNVLPHPFFAAPGETHPAWSADPTDW